VDAHCDLYNIVWEIHRIGGTAGNRLLSSSSSITNLGLNLSFSGFLALPYSQEIENRAFFTVMTYMLQT
jgi:hypothetical protein